MIFSNEQSKRCKMKKKRILITPIIWMYTICKLFKTYIYDAEQGIIGLRFYDYDKTKILKKESKTAVFLLGANLID